MNFRRKFKSNLFLQPPLESMTRTKRRNNDNMSRQPPLPPGLPPRPRNGYGNGDSYRPQSDNYYRQEPEQMYQFRGAGQNSYRPSYDQRPRHENYPPGISPPRGPATSSYRDRPSEFNFRHDAPPGLDFQASSRLRSPPRQRSAAETRTAAPCSPTGETTPRMTSSTWDSG